jgi:hypothetical protein
MKRNKDGQMNLPALRQALAATRHMVYWQGGNWITQQWSESHQAFIETPCPYYWEERQAIQYLLGYEVEMPDEASNYATRTSK